MAAAAWGAAGATAADRAQISLAGKAAKQLRAKGVRMTAAGRAGGNARRLSFPITNGNVGRRQARLSLAGSVVLRKGPHRVRVTGIQLRVGPSARLTGRLAGRRLTLFAGPVPAARRQLDWRSSGLRLKPSPVRMTAAFARAAGRRLGVTLRPGRIGRLRAGMVGVDDVPAGGIVRWGFSEPLRHRVYTAGTDLARPPVSMIDTGLCDLDLDPDPDRTPGCDPALRATPGAPVPEPTFYFPVNGSKIIGKANATISAQGGLSLLDQEKGMRLTVGNPRFRISGSTVSVGAFISLGPETATGASAPTPSWADLGQLELQGKTKVKGRTFRWRTRPGVLSGSALDSIAGFMDGIDELDPIVIEAER